MRELPKYLAVMFLGVVVFRITDIFHTIGGDHQIISFVMAALFPATALVCFGLIGLLLARMKQVGKKTTHKLWLAVALVALIGVIAVVADGFFNTVAALENLRVDQLNISPDLAHTTALGIGVMPSLLAVLLGLTAAIVSELLPEKHDLPLTRFLRKLGGGGNFGGWLAGLMAWNRPQAEDATLLVRSCQYCDREFRNASTGGLAQALRRHQGTCDQNPKNRVQPGTNPEEPGTTRYNPVTTRYNRDDRVQ